MNIKFKYVGFIMEEELLFRDIGESKFVLLDEQWGMFYLYPNAVMKCEIECMYCRSIIGMNKDIEILIGNGKVLGIKKCTACKTFALINFKPVTIEAMINEMEIHPELIKERWGYVYNLYNN